LKKEIIGFLAVILFAVFIAGCTSKKVDPMVKIAYNFLSKNEKRQIKGDWRDAKIHKVNMNPNGSIVLKQIESGKEVYSISFPSKKLTLGDIVIFIDLDKETVVGKGLRD
jgi:hypothetical protein